jgi:hypothetical protein
MASCKATLAVFWFPPLEALSFPYESNLAEAREMLFKESFSELAQ